MPSDFNFYFGREEAWKLTPNSNEWLLSRIGRITASRMVDVLSVLKVKSKNGDAGDPSGAALEYMKDIAAERLTGKAENNYVSPEMDWGTEWEPVARAAYMSAFDVMVERIGFAVHPDLEFTGASPDGLVGEDGGVEFKCPKTTTHIAWKDAGVVPEEHRPQMYWNMVCCKRKWWDFESFDPRILDPKLNGWIAPRLYLTPEIEAEYTQKVIGFEASIQSLLTRLRG